MRIKMNINWSIANTEFEKTTGAVSTVYWYVVAEESVGDEQYYTSQSSGVTQFTPDLDDPKFTPYENLTQEQVLGWVWETVDKDEIEASLAAQIEAQKNPVSATGLPW
jgi:hypothetical protein